MSVSRLFFAFCLMSARRGNTTCLTTANIQTTLQSPTQNTQTQKRQRRPRGGAAPPLRARRARRRRRHHGARPPHGGAAAGARPGARLARGARARVRAPSLLSSFFGPLSLVPALRACLRRACDLLSLPPFLPPRSASARGCLAARPAHTLPEGGRATAAPQNGTLAPGRARAPCARARHIDRRAGQQQHNSTPLSLFRERGVLLWPAQVSLPPSSQAARSIPGRQVKPQRLSSRHSVLDPSHPPNLPACCSDAYTD